MLPRTVAPETLDHLPPGDPAAQRSRADLRRINAVMGARGLLVAALRSLPPAEAVRGRPLRLLEIGCGDGRLLLGVAEALAPTWPGVELVLLDRQPLVGTATIEAYAGHGWQARNEVADVLAWASARDADAEDARYDVVLANLFLHHFEGAELAALLAAIARRSTAFIACEPRRGRLALAASHLVGFIGANAVTREDAVLSVHAGFAGSELTKAWPDGAGWHCREQGAGLFSHMFIAERKGAAS